MILNIKLNCIETWCGNCIKWMPPECWCYSHISHITRNSVCHDFLNMGKHLICISLCIMYGNHTCKDAFLHLTMNQVAFYVWMWMSFNLFFFLFLYSNVTNDNSLKVCSSRSGLVHVCSINNVKNLETSLFQLLPEPGINVVMK